MEGTEKLIYEISVEKVTRRKLGDYLIAVFIGSLVTIIFGYTIIIDKSWYDLFFIIIAWVIAAAIGYWMALEYNQFGIFNNGFCPPRKPRKFTNNPNRLFIPYNDIGKVEIEGKSFPKVPFSFTITLKSAEIIEFDVSDLMPYVKSDETELKKIFDLLVEVFNQVEKANLCKMDNCVIDLEPLKPILERR